MPSPLTPQGDSSTPILQHNRKMTEHRPGCSLPKRAKQQLPKPAHSSQDTLLQPAEMLLLIVLGVNERPVNRADHQLPTVHTFSSHQFI